MKDATRREFLADVGRGMLIASLGPTLAADLGLASAAAADGAEKLSFGKLEPLVALMQDTPAAELLPVLVGKMKDGTDLRTLTAAAALANARTFGGHDYDGYHAFMALAPAYEMSRELPEAHKPLPVLKVIFRNTSRMQAKGGSKNEVMHPIAPTALPQGGDGGEVFRDAVRAGEVKAAEQTFAALHKESTCHAYDDLQLAIQDEIDVHRVVLAWRAWETLPLTGQEHAQTLLRQSIRFCVDTSCFLKERNRPTSPIRTLLPKLLDQHKLVGRTVGTRVPDDRWVEELSQVIYGGGRDKAAEAVAAALAEGIAPKAVSEALALAATRLVLCDPGRPRDEGNRPKGSVHGASVGVHASDAANAWRNIAKVSHGRNKFASLIVGAYHTGGQHGNQNPQPYPQAEDRAKVTGEDAAALLREAEAAIKARDQARACALIYRAGELGQPHRPIFDLLLRYGVSEDGALHAEKYYRTVTEEFAAARPAFRWRHLVALARVTASEYGQPAPGYEQARKLLGV